MIHVFCQYAGIVLQNVMGMLKTNGPPFRMGRARRSLPSPKRLRAGRSPFCRAHVLHVRSARQHKGIPLLDKLSNCALRNAASNSAVLLDGLFWTFPTAADGWLRLGRYLPWEWNIQQSL